MDKCLLDLPPLVKSWQLALRAERKSPGTVKTYTAGVQAFLRWCSATGIEPEITKPNAQAFVASVLDAGAEAATAHARLKGLRMFSAWLAEEKEIAEDPLEGMRSPKLDTKVVKALSVDQIRLLIKACSGTRLADRRDEAIIRLMVESGARASEVVNIQVTDVDVDKGLVTIRRGKGGKGRVVPFGPQTGIAIDRYLRARRHHRLAGTGGLWLGGGGKTFGYSALDAGLKARAEIAGIPGFHAHLLRHTFATRWKAAQGTDDGLMAIAGWSSRTMIDRYAGAAAEERAASESRALGLGDL